MNNQYYTPSLEEFHAGFEYEYLHNDPFSGPAWFPLTLENADLSYVKDQIKEEEIRVCRLCRDGIEALGWTCVEETKFSDGSYGYLFTYKKGEAIFRMTCSGKEGTIKQGVGAISIRVKWEHEDEWKNRLFHGTLKNKSELKIIMQQIGIL